MKLVLIKSHLRDAISIVSHATTENQNLPILKNILLEVKDGTIVASGTNLEIAIRQTIPGKVMEGGKITIPANAFLQIITNLSSERVNLEEKNNMLQIKTDNYEATLNCVSAEEFPLIPTIKKERGAVKIKGVLLKEGLSQVVTSALASELRPELGSILFWFSIDALKLVATDSFRLAEKIFAKNQFTTTHEEQFRILVPMKTAQELLKIIQEDEDVVFREDGGQIIFTTPRTTLVSRLIDGKFPDYEAIVPKKFDTEVVADTQELISAIKLSSVFGSKVSEMKIKILENKKSIQIYSSEQGLGENSSVLSARITGDVREVSFNWRYFLDGLRAIKTGDIFIGFADEAKPALLKSPNEASYFYLVMPILKS